MTRRRRHSGGARCRARDSWAPPSLSFRPWAHCTKGIARSCGELAKSPTQTVVSIFVNPLQFAAGEDLDRYPRPLDADLAMCAEEGVALAFVPSRTEMYPREPVVRVSAGAMGQRFEGASRAGHFDGVLTVVAKLFGLVRPDVAVFGRKDAQQLALVRAMVADLDLPVRIEAAPLIRDADGLALSSRNAYLTAPDRAAALALSRALQLAPRRRRAARRRRRLWLRLGRCSTSQPGVETDYVALVDPDTFEDVAADAHVVRQAVLAVAARVGATRLIDNESVEVTG